MSNVIKIPSCALPLPPDAISRRSLQVLIQPNLTKGGWDLHRLNDSGGGIYLIGKTKAKCISYALRELQDDNAEIEIRNTPTKLVWEMF